MRNTIATTLVAVFFAAGLVGCKSAPKLAFWKAGDRTAAVGEETVLANSAPALPADIARQAESLAMSSPTIDMGAPASLVSASGGLAAPYTPPSLASRASMPAMNVATTGSLGSGAKPAPTVYPTTGAAPYSAATAPVMAAITPTLSPVTKNLVVNAAPPADSLGSVSLPYNPNAVPPARAVAAVSVTPSVSADRYGSSALASTAGLASTAPAYTASVPAVVPVRPSGAGRYGSLAATPVASSPSPAIVNTPAVNAVNVNVAATGSVTPSVPKSTSVYGTPAAAGLMGGRYASTMPSQPVITPTPTLKASPTPAPAVTSAPVVTSAPALASAPNYRPGGTASYQGTAPNLSAVEIATRPKPYKVEATPSTRYEPVPAPRYR